MTNKLVHHGPKYDNVYKHVKSFGRYQMLLYVFTHFLVFPISSQFSALVFAKSAPGFHCVTANVTCPRKQCCDGCVSYVFDGPFTSIVSEWNLICGRAYLRAIIQSCYFAGMLLGSLVTGMISDAWGRKKCMFFCNGIMLSAGVGSAFVDSIPFFAFLRFVVGFGLVGAMLSLYVYGMELVGPNHRTIVGNLSMGLFLNISGIGFALISYFIPSWRILLTVTTAPAALLFLFWKWIPESPRWLVAHDRLDQAVVVIQKYGAKDGNPVDVEILTNLLKDVRSEQITAQEEKTKYTPIDLLRTPKMRKWTIIVCYQWFAIALGSMGILLFMSQLSGNIHLNYVIIRAANVLRIPLTWIVFLKFGRRIPHGVTIFIAGACLLLVLAVNKHAPTATTVLALAGMILINCNWTSVYMITSELFPTLIRNTAMGTGSTSARIGGIIAPYVAMMGQLPGLTIAFPSAIFGSGAVLAGILMYWIPETLYSPMHQTIQQTEAAEEDWGMPCCRHRQPTLVDMEMRESENLVEKV